MTGAIEATGQVASEVVGGLKQTPLVLAIIVLVAIGAGLNYWFIGNLIERGHERTMYLFERCLPQLPARNLPNKSASASPLT